MDRIDKDILKIIQSDGRLSTAELSEKVGLSPSPCARRLKRLEEEGYIESYQARLNKAKVGIGMSFFVDVRLNNHQASSVEDFERDISAIEEAINVHIVSGAYDYLVEVVSKDLAGFEAFTRKLHRLSSVKDFHTHLAVRQVKGNTALPIYL
ncbi:Lrp/AsnC family transcriptional regulator [Marinomonas arenicola]|uniref:Lrp/AsnC family transcriptional regulator n=1 Tax=Marinomonas arenicola TaxID=569601 RepID=UPI00311F7B38